MSWNLSTAAPCRAHASKIKLWDFNRYLLHLTESVVSNTQCLFRSFPIAHDSSALGCPGSVPPSRWTSWHSLASGLCAWFLRAQRAQRAQLEKRWIWRAMAGVTRGYTGYTDQEHMEKWHGKCYRKQGATTYREKWPISSYYSHRRTCSNNRVMMKFKINKKTMDMRKIEEIVWYCLATFNILTYTNHGVLVLPIVATFQCSNPGGRMQLPVFPAAGMDEFGWQLETHQAQQSLPSGKHTKNYGKSPFLMGNSTINGHFQ